MTTRNYIGNTRRLLALTLAACLATGSIFAYAHNSNEQAEHHGANMHASTYQAIDLAHLHAIAEHVRKNSSPDQLAKIEALTAIARPELETLNQQAMGAHRRTIELLLQDDLDRNVLAQAQLDELQAADALTKRINEALKDLAELLTPEQRAQFRAHFKAHMG
ncbi:MAG: Spy/CpxP family protein refolding chaperone [Arenimonas sp.]